MGAEAEPAQRSWQTGNLPDSMNVLNGVTDLFPQLLLIELHLRHRKAALSALDPRDTSFSLLSWFQARLNGPKITLTFTSSKGKRS